MRCNSGDVPQGHECGPVGCIECRYESSLAEQARQTEGGLAQGHGVGLLAFGGAYWPLAIPTPCGSERGLVVSTEPPEDLPCLTSPGSAVPETGCCPCRLATCAVHQASPDTLVQCMLYSPAPPRVCVAVVNPFIGPGGFLIQKKKAGVSSGQQNLHSSNRWHLRGNRRRLEGNRRRLETKCY